MMIHLFNMSEETMGLIIIIFGGVLMCAPWLAAIYGSFQ